MRQVQPLGGDPILAHQPAHTRVFAVQRGLCAGLRHAQKFRLQEQADRIVDDGAQAMVVAAGSNRHGHQRHMSGKNTYSAALRKVARASASLEI